MFRSDGLEAVRKGENRRAIELLQLSLKHEATTDNERQEVLQLLCELHFKEKAFDDCLDAGRKLKETYNTEKNEKDEVIIELQRDFRKVTPWTYMQNHILSTWKGEIYFENVSRYFENISIIQILLQ